MVLHSTAAWTIRQPAGLEGPEEPAHRPSPGRARCSRSARVTFSGNTGDRTNSNVAVDWLRQRHPGVTGMAKMLFDRAAERSICSPPNPTSIHAGSGRSAIPWEPKRFSIWPRLTSVFAHRYRARVESVWDFSNWDAPWYLGETIKRPGFTLTTPRSSPCALLPPFSLIGGQSADGDRSWPYIAESDAGLEAERRMPKPSVSLITARDTLFPSVAEKLHMSGLIGS